ncbi:2-acylglycerol O-acyltransferase [Aureococcus anophagefferens]|nr:2-acylglycerol O-acyltransferase [Aureococcus anophagefferens]
MAPVLFRIPLLRQALLGFGCCTPATKQGMFSLFRKNLDFGILPGGMEEVALYSQNRDRVFIRKRAGFIKYALQHGYNLQPAFTFGESDIYASLQHPLYRRCLFTLKHAGFVIPVFWGPRWYCPLLPRDDVALHTVIAHPAIHDDHKARFGYGHRADLQ